MEVARAISGPTRQRIVVFLGSGAQAAGDPTAQFDPSVPAISQREFHKPKKRENNGVRVRLLVLNLPIE